MTELKEATRAVHARIEAALRVTDPALGLPGYVEVLQRFLGFYGPAEALLARCEGLRACVPDLDGRLKVPLLRRDLRALSMDDEADHCRSIPLVDGVPRALGCLYVFEGATLGGRVIGRHLSAHLGLDASCGAAFFAGYGERTGPMWQRMQASLRARLVSPADRQEAARAACDVFRALEAWLAPRH